MKRGISQGSALLVTLFLVVIITGVAVGFLTTARVERATVHSHFEKLRASGFAEAGINHSIATLRQETTSRCTVTEADGSVRSVFRNYLTMPGALVVPDVPTGAVDDLATQFQLRRIVPLTSGSPQTLAHTDPVLNPPNLNIPTYTSDQPAARLLTDRMDTFTGQPVEMRVKWTYLRQNKNGQPGNPAVWTQEEDTSETPLLDEGRPIIGRHAWWVDDESTKVNYNTAWKRDPGPSASMHSNPSRPSHPSCVNLMGLTYPNGTSVTEGTVDTLFRWRDRSPNRPFNSFADARQADPSLLPVLDFNKFELTHYNHDPDTTFFGEDRILLTTRRELVPKVNGVYARKFIDILRDDVSPGLLDPGLRDDIAGGQEDWRTGVSAGMLPNKFDAAVRGLIRYLSEANWPLATQGSFKDKYYPGSSVTDPRIAQIAVNIIDYVRAKESRQLLVAPLHYGLDASGRYTVLADHAFGPNSFVGVARAPYITEMGMSVAANPVTMPAGATETPANWPRNASSGAILPLYPCTFKFEVHLPANYKTIDSAGTAGFNLVPVRTRPFPAGALRCWFVTLTEASAMSRNYYFQSPTTSAMVRMKDHATGAMPINVGEAIGSTGTTLEPGRYITVTKTLYREEPFSAASVVQLQCGLYQGTSGADGLLGGPLVLWPCYNMAPKRSPVLYTINDSASPLISVEVDDPRCNLSTVAWQVNKNGGGTFGAVNSVSSVGLAPAQPPPGQPQQDTDGSGNISDYSASMPYPYGAGTNSLDGDNGRLTSVGELGYVCTGTDATGAAVPWRSLRLQPGNITTGSPSGVELPGLPDWALLDLFAVLNTSSTKVKEPAAIYTPHGASVGGRVNLNSRVVPFTGMDRTSAIRAAFTGAKGLKHKNDAAIIAGNIYRHELATGANPGRVYGVTLAPSAEVSVPSIYSSAGEICEIKGVADTGESGEDLVRDVVSLFTTRGGVFTIHTVGQSLQQTRGGKLQITAEQRRQAVVERVIENQGTISTSDDEIRFRTLYMRNLSP